MKERIAFFDLDSTLVKVEGLDLLAERKGLKIGAEVRGLTELAMNGDIPFEESMGKKMDLIRPSRQDMEYLAEQYMNNLTEDAREVINEIRDAGIQIGIMTGNFLPAVLPFAAMLGIEAKNVHGNNIFFDENGQYAGYDSNNPLWKSNGKADEMQRLRPHYRRITMVGDGSSDLKTKPFVDRFIGFGGIAERPSVKAGTDVYIASPSLAPVLLDVLPAWRRGLRRVRRNPLMKKAREATVIRR